VIDGTVARTVSAVARTLETVRLLIPAIRSTILMNLRSTVKVG
jgi:hypothetical protein